MKRVSASEMIRKFFFQLFLMSFLAPLVYGQKTDSLSNYSNTENENLPAGYFGLFEDDEIIEITLKFDLSTYFRKKPKDDFLKTEMTIHLSETDSLVRNVRLKTRGVFRNRFCAFAPIELNFKKVDFGYPDLDSIGKLKLVTQCGYGTDDEGYILREYLVYKLFNILTDTSFRVRLLRINYIDSERERKPVRQYGFFLEPVDMLAARISTLRVKTTTLNQKHIVPFVMDRLALFNYMIGNYDWSIPGQHNVEVFKPVPFSFDQHLIAIPFDFDWSGIVNASYAIPAENVGTNSVRERIFLGVCRENKVFNKDLNVFWEHKDDFYTVINEIPYLKERDKTDIKSFLDDFFDELDGDRANILFYLQNSCKRF